MATSKEDQTQHVITQQWQDPSIAENYRRAENATRPFAEVLVKRARFEDAKEVYAFDLACGTGAVIASLYDAVPKNKSVKVLGGDISQPMLDSLKARGKSNGWEGLEAKVIDGTKLDLPENTFTHAFVNFGIFIMPLDTVTKLHSVIKPGGFLGVTSWTAFPWYTAVVQAIKNLPNPPFIPPEADIRARIYAGSDWHEPAFVQKLLEERGFKDVQVEVQSRDTACGTPKQFVEVMNMPMQLVKGFWPAEKRDQLMKDVMSELQKIMVEEAGGEDKQVVQECTAIIASGWKAE